MHLLADVDRSEKHREWSTFRGLEFVVGERREMLNISTSVAAVERAAKLWYFMITAGLPPRDRTRTIIPCSNFFPIKDNCIRSKVPPAWLQRARRIFDETDRGMPSQKKLCIAPMRHSTSILSTLSWTNRPTGHQEVISPCPTWPRLSMCS